MAKRKKPELPHWGSKGAINRAGDAIRAGTISDEHATALESWRMAHATIIHTFEAMLRRRAKGRKIKVGQRLKRRSTICDKLLRQPKMEMARMDDVAGVRVIFQSEKELRAFRDKVHGANFKHIRKNEKDRYDYIKKPKDTGYRGIHDIYEYRGRGKSKKCDGLLIEVQYRTDIQHAWSTAVEVITQTTKHEPKFGRGDERVIKQFSLAAEILARRYERKAPGPGDLPNKELVEEFERLEVETGVMQTLSGIMVTRWVSERRTSEHVILHIPSDGNLKLHQYDLELEAQSALVALEKQFPKDNIVLVGAKSIEDVMYVYRNYFNDVGEFLSMMLVASFNLADRPLPPEFTGNKPEQAAPASPA